MFLPPQTPPTPATLAATAVRAHSFSNFSDGIKRGRNVTGASYGAQTNDGVVTDLKTSLAACLTSCLPGWPGLPGGSLR